jgi:hypothetical protein
MDLGKEFSSCEVLFEFGYGFSLILDDLGLIRDDLVLLGRSRRGRCACAAST